MKLTLQRDIKHLQTNQDMSSVGLCQLMKKNVRITICFWQMNFHSKKSTIFSAYDFQYMYKITDLRLLHGGVMGDEGWILQDKRQ